MLICVHRIEPKYSHVNAMPIFCQISCTLIASTYSHVLTIQQGEKLILTGPKRGLALLDAIFIEIDLKIKGAGKQKKDKQLSKGFVEVIGSSHFYMGDMLVERSLHSMLSEVVVMCAVEKFAVEATIAVEVVYGKFCGEITACTTNIKRSLVLYDSKLVSEDGKGVIPLLRRVIVVGMKEKLMVTFARAGVCKVDGKRTIKFTPNLNGRFKAEVTCGSVKMVNVAWSVIDPLRVPIPSRVLRS